MLALGALTLLALKAFVADVYPVRTRSMDPTIRPGEHVLVRYDSSPPERFDLVVISRGGEAFVKRAVGLGRDAALSIVAGDVFIGGRPLPPNAPRPEPIVVFDSRQHDVATHFAMGGTQVNPWKQADGEWELDAREVPLDHSSGLLRYHKGVRDEELEPVGDVIVECSFLPLEATGRVRLVLVEQGDTFQFAVELGPDGQGMATLSRLSSGEERMQKELARREVRYRLGAWQRMRFENVDNHLRGELGDPAFAIEASYAKNSLHPKDLRGEGFSLGERAKIGGESCLVRFRDILIARDLHVSPRGEFGIERSVQLDPDEIFVLGDNSAASRDSREWGPIPRSSVRGRASWVVWPPSAIRPLRGAVSRPDAN